MEKKIINRHGFLGWIFKKDSCLSALIVFPNDDDYSNHIATGERLFINPLDFPELLDTNFIRYNKKDLYLFGLVERFHVKRYCVEVDSFSTLYYQGDSAYMSECSRAVPIAASSGRFSRDWSVRASIKTDSLSRLLSIRIVYKGSEMIFSGMGAASIEQDSLMLFAALYNSPGTPIQPARVLLTPRQGLREGKPDSSLILTASNQVLGFHVQENGHFIFKKLWLLNHD